MLKRRTCVWICEATHIDYPGRESRRLVSHTILLKIADLAVGLRTHDLAMAGRLQHLYHDFLAPQATPLLLIDLQLKPEARYVRPTQRGELWVIQTTFTPEKLHYASYAEQGEVDLQGGTGYLELDPQAGVENFLRVVYAWLCLQHQALLLHAAGVVRQGQGYVFFGPSGAGKTTTSRLAAATGEVLSDDLVIIRAHQDRYQLYGVPFKGALETVLRPNRVAPLQGLFRLQQSTHHQLRPLPHPVAVVELAASAPFIARESVLGAQLLELCYHLVRQVPVYQLHFRRDDGFWRVIDEALTPSIPIGEKQTWSA